MKLQWQKHTLVNGHQSEQFLNEILIIIMTCRSVPVQWCSGWCNGGWKCYKLSAKWINTDKVSLAESHYHQWLFLNCAVTRHQLWCPISSPMMCIMCLQVTPHLDSDVPHVPEVAAWRVLYPAPVSHIARCQSVPGLYWRRRATPRMRTGRQHLL